jgi:hypothetical protein
MKSYTLIPNARVDSRNCNSCMLQRDSKITKTAGEMRAWLEAQDVYTLHRPVRKIFPRNPYAVNNIMAVWECDLFDVQGLSKYKDGIKYLLSVRDVYS